MTTTSPRSLLRHHDFTVLWVGQTLSELGTRVSGFVFPLVAYAVTGSVAAAAAVQAAELLGLAGALLPAGVLADRFDRRLLLRTASGLGAVAYASLAIAAVVGHVSLVHLLATALCGGIAAGLFDPVELSAVRTVVAPDDLPAALSLNQGRRHVASLVGAPLGGLLYGLSRMLPFAVDALTYLVSWLLLGRLRADLTAPAADHPRASMLDDLRQGVGFVVRHRLLRTVACWGFLTNLAGNALFMVAVLRLVRDGVAPLQIGLVETVAGGAGIVGALLAPWLIARVPTGLLTVAIGWSMVPLAVPIALYGHPSVVAAGLGLVMLLNPAGNAGMQAYRVAVTPGELIGRVQAALSFTSLVALPIAPALAGVLLALLGGRDAVLAAAGLCAAAALIPLLSRTVRTIPRPDRWPTATAATDRVPLDDRDGTPAPVG